MKNIPNIPATDTTWIRLAPETSRERKIDSGMRGVRAVYVLYLVVILLGVAYCTALGLLGR